MRRIRRHLGAGEAEAGFNLSWGAIIAGVVTITALLIMFTFVGSAIGLGVVEPTSNDPFEGVGIGLAIWTVLAFVLAFFGGGFVAGITSRRVGIVHGFLTWATSLIALVIMVSYIASGVFSLAGSVLGGVARGAGTVAESTIDITGSALGTAFDNVADEAGTVDTEELQNDINEVLEDTDIPELQPDYIEGQIEAATDDIVEAGQAILTNPEEADAILDDLLNSLQERAETIGEAADEEAIANAIEENTDLTQAESEEAAQNVVETYETTAAEAEEIITNLQAEVDNLQVEVEQTIQDARVTAEEATDAGSRYSIWAFVAILLSLVLTSFAGLLGSNLVKSTKNETRI
ncbi:hypothetical protein ADIAL_1166 [Alkalibacterium sp. AK22]|uniref:hypothetical protein n=1 Tax=Alkalibacterium sp. AK22 TaxID=1229520 RepID=UPI000449EDDC|nr:hypothetical protein [Alkalibacterium sp. AK22]EXJ23361.1 hypothetical protein ADIAL_1166 [Alkalibacterium sp. AK22]